MDKTFISWDQFHKDCDITAVKASGITYDYMIALSRGGVVPARIMAEIIKPKNFLILGLKLYNEYTSGDEVQITQDLDTSLFDRQDIILIVDDISDKGTTLSYAVSHVWKKSGGAHVSTACPYIKESTSKIPNYYHRTYSDDEWIVFPFEKD